MALMTSTGAKGSKVNFSQISCLLGQQVRLLMAPRNLQQQTQTVLKQQRNVQISCSLISFFQRSFL